MICTRKEENKQLYNVQPCKTDIQVTTNAENKFGGI